ncbi:hypothetical protein CLAUR_015290 [Clostridium felsineum]|nr:hypothetical protein CLAUR_015290 [Clostridium felsineum]
MTNEVRQVMDKLESIKEIKNYIQSNELVLIYFKTEDNGICRELDSLIESISEKYNKMSSAKVDTGNLPAVPNDFKMFTVPEIVVFMKGTVVVEQSRYINFREIEEVLSNYYKYI